MLEPGHIYILVNPSIDGLVKIGKTTRDPDSRAKELSQATGVPTPFYVAFSIEVADCHCAEELAFAVLEVSGFKRAPNREFFQMPLRKAIEVLMGVEQHFKSALGNAHASASEGAVAELACQAEENAYSVGHPGSAILKQALETRVGAGDSIKDEAEAFRLLQQAKALNYPPAYIELAKCLTEFKDYEPGTKKDFDLALEILKEGVQKGHGACFIAMAFIYISKQEPDNASKCWKKYFQSRTFANDEDSKWDVDAGQRKRAGAAVDYFTTVSFGLPLDPDIRQILIPVKDEIRSFLQTLIDYQIEVIPLAQRAQPNKSLDWSRRHLHFIETSL